MLRLKQLLFIFILCIIGGWTVDRFILRSASQTLPPEEQVVSSDSEVLNTKSFFEQDYTETKVYQAVSQLFTPTKSAGTASTITITDIVEATNKERLAAGVPPLAIHAQLNKSAAIKVNDMIARQYFEHDSPTGEGVSDLGDEVGYNYVIMGENLAMGAFTDSADVVRAWMESPGHKENILNKKYQDIGVAAMRGMYEGKEVWFAVQHFGTNRGVCPPINDQLKRDIDLLNQQLRVEEGIIVTLKRSLEAPGAQNSSTYPSDVQTFNRYVEDYNSKLKTSRKKIEIYNAEIKNFNRCITTFQ